MAFTTPVWITDSSMVEWQDTVRLSVPFPRWKWPQAINDALGGDIDDSYEGLVDPAVPHGGVQLEWREGGLDPEAEWILLFDKPLIQYESIGPETPCRLQGMIEGKWIAPLAKKDNVHWAESTLGNNLIARGHGITTTLGGILEGRDNVPGAMVMVNFQMANGDMAVHRAFGEKLMHLPVIDIVKAVWEWARENPEQGGAVSAVNLGANGEMNAYASDPHRLGAAAKHAVLSHFIEKLIELCPHELFKVVNEAREDLFTKVIDRAEFARPGGNILLSVTSGGAGHALVGEGLMLLVEKDESENAPEPAS